MMKTKLISVIIPTFNRADLLHETLDSFIAQTYKNWECLLVDDGSTDTTVEVIKKYVLKDKRFKLFSRPPNRLKGANACRNYGFEQSSGAYINWFDSDDIAAPRFLEEKMNLLIDNQQIDMAACYGERFYDDGRKNKRVLPNDSKTDNAIRNYILHDFSFHTPSPLWRKQVLDVHNEFFDEEMHRSQEKDFHFRMILKGVKFIRYTVKPLFFIRSSNEGISNTASKNILAKKSVFKLREKQFNLLKGGDNFSTALWIEYLFYRQADNYYTIITSATSSNKKKQYKKEYFPKLMAMVSQSHLSKRFYFKLFIGNIMLQLFNKGYKFFYFPQFDHRSF